MVITVTQPGLAPPGVVSCPVEPASAAASMARTNAEMPPAPDAAQKEANRRASSRRRAPFSGHPQCGKVAGGGKNFFQQLLCQGTLRAICRRAVSLS